MALAGWAQASRPPGFRRSRGTRRIPGPHPWRSTAGGNGDIPPLVASYSTGGGWELWELWESWELLKLAAKGLIYQQAVQGQDHAHGNPGTDVNPVGVGVLAHQIA